MGPTRRRSVSDKGHTRSLSCGAQHRFGGDAGGRSGPDRSWSTIASAQPKRRWWKGWEKEAATIQDLYLSGRKEEAAAAVPDDLLEQTSLIGPESYIKDRIDAYRAAGVTVVNITPVGSNGTEDVTRLKNLVA
jgi:hypothetical protein